MFDLAPGNILQGLHFRRRLRALHRELGRPARFVEIGAGTGWLSAVALAEGCSGTGYDLNPAGCAASALRNAAAVADGRYRIIQGSFGHGWLPESESVDLVFSCMVLEHLSAQEISELIGAARQACGPRPVFAAFVPSGMRYWGIEDEIAGHLRRYEPADVRELTRRENLMLRHQTGLTFPLSNLLRPWSNRLVARAESAKLERSIQERTIASGHREVWLKTRFPDWVRWILNRWTLWPFDVLQRIFGRSRRSMVLYCEWELLAEPAPHER